MKESIKQFLQKTFDIREGELYRTSLMQITIFLIISTLLIIKPTINSLFLSEVGIQNLPVAFILVAFAAGIITTFYSKWLNRIPFNKVFHYTLVISVIFIFVFSILLRLNFIEKWVLYIFYVWVAIFGVLATSQFWILANIVFNAREAKRLFSMIGGGAIAGGIFGGYLTSILAPLIGSENLLFIGGLFLIICIPLIKKIWNSNLTTSNSVFVRKKRVGKVSEHPIRLIIKSKHLTYLALITAVSVLVAKLVDYQFSAISSGKITDPDELTAFFGFWFSNFNIISLLIQLFITRRIVGVYGVGVSLFFLPAGIFIGALAVLFTPGLWSAIFIKSADGSLKQSLNKSALELLALPIPVETKNQAKTFIDVFVDSFATGLSGIILITVVNSLHLSVHFVSLIIIFLIGFWVYFATKVRREYLSLFKRKLNLKDQSNNVLVSNLDLGRDSIYGGLRKVLEKGSEPQIKWVLQNMPADQNERFFNSIETLLDHPSPEIVSDALKRLYHYKREDITSKVSAFVNHPNQAVRIAAVEYIIAHATHKRIDVYKTYLNHHDEKISSATLLALANEAKDNRALKEKLHLEEIIQKRINRLSLTMDRQEKLFGLSVILGAIATAKVVSFYDYLQSFFKSEDSEEQALAVHAAGISLDERFIDELLPFLLNEKLNKLTTDALINYGFRILPRLNKLQQNQDSELIRELPYIIEQIGTQESVDQLFALVNHGDIAVRNQAVKSLSNLRGRKPHLIFNNKQIVQNILDEARLFFNTLTALYFQHESLRPEIMEEKENKEVVDARKSLIKHLEKRLDDNLDRIFKILGLKYPPDEITGVYKGIKSDKAEIRINSVEFLDNLLESSLKRVLIPIIETSLTETITKETLKELKIKISTQYECFSFLLEGRDVKTKLSVLYLLTVLKDKAYLPMVTNQLNDHNEKVRTFALNAKKAILDTF